MADSLALRVAKVEKELLKSRLGLAGVTVNLKEEDTQADATRLVITATLGAAEMQDATNPTGIFNVSVKVEVFVQMAADSAARVDAYISEIAEANDGRLPTTPSAGFASALAQLSLFQHKDDIDTAQEDGEEIRKAERTFTVLARKA